MENFKGVASSSTSSSPFAADADFKEQFKSTISDDPKALRTACEAFDLLMLPQPEKTQFLSGSGCLLVFLNDYGIVLRIEKMKEGLVPPDHENVLRPLWMIAENGIRFEMLPGILPACNSDIAQKLSVDLERRGIVFSDIKGENVGYLPNVRHGAEAFPIVLDRGCLAVTKGRDDLKIRMKPHAMRINHVSPYDRQRMFYRPLYTKVAEFLPPPYQGWKRALDKMKPEKVLAFWEFCRAEVTKFENGQPSLLGNDWSGAWQQAAAQIPKGIDAERVGKRYSARSLKPAGM